MRLLWRLLFCISTLLSNMCWLSKGDECGNNATNSRSTATQSNSKDWILLNNTGYCFVNECTIRIMEYNVLLNIVNKTTNRIIAINATDYLFTVPAANDSDFYCSLEDPKIGFFIFIVVVYLIIIISSSLNTILHLVAKELHTIPGMMIIGICGTIIIIFICVTTTAVFQYLYRVSVVVCAVFKYITSSFGVIYTMLKATYLFHFAYLMYISYTLRPCKRGNKKLLFLYGAVVTTAGMVCSVLLIVTDLLYERTAFATDNGYCADYYQTRGVSDKILIAIVVILGVVQIVFFIIAITLYYLTTKRFCTCGSTSETGPGPSNIRVSIALTAVIGLGALLFVTLFLAGVAGESTVIASSISTCVEQVILLIVFLTSKKIQAKLQKCFERKKTDTESSRI